MYKKHSIAFSTITGIDNRAEMITQTYSVMRNYLDKFYIIDTGSTDSTCELSKLPKVSYIRVNKSPNNDWKEMLVVATTVDTDWLIYMDSDERPTQEFLDNLKDNITYLENNNICQANVYGLLHLDGRLGSDVQTPKQFKNKIKLKTIHHTPVPELFFRPYLLKTGTFSIANNGAHFSFLPKFVCKSTFLPEYYLHLKTESQDVISWVLCSYPYLRFHGCPANCPEETALLELANKHSINTAEQLQTLALDNRLHSDFYELIKSWQNSTYEVCVRYYRWMYQYNFRINNTLPHCGRECCNYRDGVQF